MATAVKFAGTARVFHHTIEFCYWDVQPVITPTLEALLTQEAEATAREAINKHYVAGVLYYPFVNHRGHHEDILGWWKIKI